MNTKTDQTEKPTPTQDAGQLPVEGIFIEFFSLKGKALPLIVDYLGRLGEILVDERIRVTAYNDHYRHAKDYDGPYPKNKSKRRRSDTLDLDSKRLIPLSYTLEQASRVTGLSERTLRRLVSRGLLRPSRAIQRFIFSRAEIDRFLQETTAE